MNYSMLRYVLGRLFLVIAGLMVLPLLVSFIYREPGTYQWAFIATISILLVVGLPMGSIKPRNHQYYSREGLVIVSLSWVFLSLFGALPFFISGDIPIFVDAVFETASGFTTTGSSILTDVESLAHSILFWRSFTHLIGGMGVLVFALALMPKSGHATVHVMKAEVPGPIFGKLLSRVSDTARILYLIYLSMTLVLIVVLCCFKMPFFDACLHAFGAAGTGGFGIKSNSVAFYQSPAIEWILGIAVLLFGVNFNLYYYLLLRQVKTVLKNEELRWYLGIFTVATAAICLGIRPLYHGRTGDMIRDAFFTAASIQTTTGYTTADYSQWPLYCHGILLLLSCIGASAGSTAGGLKVSRVVIYIKQAFVELRSVVSPKRTIRVHFEGKPLDQRDHRSISYYLATYSILLVIFTLILSTCTPDFETAVSSVVATFNNIGPGLGRVGPTGSYAFLPAYGKITLTLAMLAGRLELFPILILFYPRTWKRR